MAKNFNINVNISSPVFYILIGLLTVILGQGIIGWAIWIAGALFIVMAVLDFLGKRMNGAIINGIIGAAILVFGGLVAEFAITVLGILIAIRGVMDLLEVLKREHRNSLQLILPIITIVIGVGFAFGSLLNDLIRVIGVLLIVDGVLELLKVKKK